MHFESSLGNGAGASAVGIAEIVFALLNSIVCLCYSKERILFDCLRYGAVSFFNQASEVLKY